jgi:glycosyltransferase involved in cell wall biosynthesis
MHATPPPEKIHILFAHYLPHIVSGAERSLADLVEGLADRFQVTMLTPGEGRLADFYAERGVAVWAEAISTPRRLYPGLHTLHSWRAARQLKMQGIDVVVANTFAAASRVRSACRMAGIPFGIYVREIISDRPIHREILDQADRVMVISQDLQAHVSRMTDPAKVRLTYNYIQPRPILERAEEHRRAGRRRLPFGREHPVVGVIGRITPWKQQDLFIRAAARVLEEVPQARFAIVGAAEPRDMGYEQELHRLVDSLGLREFVAFMGQRNDAIEITTELAISALTSTREPLGRVILEAHLLGTAVVAPGNAGPAEIVQDGVTGLLFDPLASDAVDQFARQVLRLLKDPGLRHNLAENGRHAISQTFAGREHIAIQERVFDELAALRQPKREERVAA